MKKLVKMNRLMIERLNTVDSQKADPQQRALRDIFRQFLAFPVPGPMEMFCDRCMGTSTPIRGEEFWTIPFYRMVICDSCEREVRAGADALSTQYFASAQNILSTLLSPEEIEAARKNGPAWTLQHIIAPHPERWSRGKRPWPALMILQTLWDAFDALSERASLEEWRKLPLE